MSDIENTNDYPQDNTASGSTFPMLLLGIGGAIVIAIILFLVLGSGDDETPNPVVIEAPIVTEPDPEPIADPEPVQENDYLPAEPNAIEEPIAIAEPEPEPAPLDISDSAVKTALLALSEAPDFARLLVDEDLLSRFVVFTENLANQELAGNHQLLREPESGFRVYRQAGKEWIDSASYQRYSAYVEVLDSIDAVQLLALYQIYKPTISEIYAEIGDPDEDFDYRLLDAIDHLLHTPEIPVPVEVYTDSVMYKYRIDQVEDLTAPQKQLLRTGPENMRLIKAKLREIKSLLNS